MTQAIPAIVSAASGGLNRLARSRLQPAFSDNELDDLIDTFPGFQIGEDKTPFAAHAFSVAVHHLEARADQRRQIDLVDDQQVGSGNPRAALARDFIAGGDVDHINRQIGELGRKCRGEIVAARLDQDHVKPRERPVQFGDRREVDRGVLADRGVRTAAGLDAADAFGRQRTAAGQKLGVLAGIDVVGDRDDLEALAHALAEMVHQRGLAGADRSANADAQRPAIDSHERKSLEYWVSCAIEARSNAKVAAPKSCMSRANEPVTVALTARSNAARMRCPSLCPTMPSRKPADIRLAAKAWR